MPADLKVTVRVRPRLHLGLVSMHAGGPRKNGGVGFAVRAPDAVVTAVPSTLFELNDHRSSPLGEGEAAQLRKAVERTTCSDGLERSISVGIAGGLRTHVGMGSGTAIRLGVLEALYVINGMAPTRDQLVLRSGRGGTSGVGVTTYFEGGFVMDLGRLSDGSDFRPSSLGNESPPPTTLPPLAMPDWPVLLCLPREFVTKTQKEEIEFFERTLPLAPVDSFQAAYEAVFGMYAAVAERDRPSFCNAVEAMQRSAWKAAEWHHHGPWLSRLGERLLRLGVDCCGLSSLGPLLFCLGESDVLHEVMRSQDVLDCDMMITGPITAGRLMTVTPLA